MRGRAGARIRPRTGRGGGRADRLRHAIGDARPAALAGRAPGERDGAAAGAPPAGARAGALLATARAARVPALAAVADGRDRGARTADRGRARPRRPSAPRRSCASTSTAPRTSSGPRYCSPAASARRAARARASAGLRSARAAIQHEIGAAVRSDAWAAMPANASSCWTSSSVGALTPASAANCRDPFRAVHGARA